MIRALMITLLVQIYCSSFALAADNGIFQITDEDGRERVKLDCTNSAYLAQIYPQLEAPDADYDPSNFQAHIVTNIPDDHEAEFRFIDANGNFVLSNDPDLGSYKFYTVAGFLVFDVSILNPDYKGLIVVSDPNQIEQPGEDY